MKKTGMAIVAAVFMFAACGGKAAAEKEFGQLFDDGTKSLNDLGKTFAEAKDAKAVAAAVEKFVALIEDFKAKGDALEKKHGISAKGEMPAALKAKAETFQKAAAELGKGPMGEAMKKFASSPEVQASIKKLQALR